MPAVALRSHTLQEGKEHGKALGVTQPRGAAKNAPSKSERQLRTEGHRRRGSASCRLPGPQRLPGPRAALLEALLLPAGPLLAAASPPERPPRQGVPSAPSPEAGGGGFLSAGTPAGGGPGPRPTGSTPLLWRLQCRGPALVCWGFPAGLCGEVAESRRLARPWPGSRLEAEVRRGRGKPLARPGGGPGRLGGREAKDTLQTGSKARPRSSELFAPVCSGRPLSPIGLESLSRV